MMLRDGLKRTRYAALREACRLCFAHEGPDLSTGRRTDFGGSADRVKRRGAVLELPSTDLWFSCVSLSWIASESAAACVGLATGSSSTMTSTAIATLFDGGAFGWVATSSSAERSFRFPAQGVGMADSSMSSASAGVSSVSRDNPFVASKTLWRKGAYEFVVRGTTSSCDCRAGNLIAPT